MKVKIYACYHRKYNAPKSKLIIPIHVGKAIAKIDLGITGDNIGDNISTKNPYYCELTALYWIWKNVDDADIVGLCHYRCFLTLLKIKCVLAMGS